MSLEKLIKGFQTFRSSYFEENDHYKDLVRGQLPETMVIACSDSRNDPAHLMQSKPGEIFVVRNVAAIVPPYQPDQNYHGTSTAIEFAVRGLKVKNIVVLGHGLCGGVQALAGNKKNLIDFEFLLHWITIGSPAKEKVDDLLKNATDETRLLALEQAMILTSLNNLMTFPWIKDGTKSGEITLYGWYFDMMNGKLLGYDFAEGAFKQMEAPDSENLKFTKGCCSGWPLETLIKSHI